MSEVLEAELAPSGSLKTGWIDLGRNDLFRDIWVVIFYLGLMLPYAFIGLWLGKVANNQFQLPIGVIAVAIMLLKVPFFLRLIWAQPVERFVTLPLGRRRSWMIFGTLLHIVLLIPLFFLDVRESIWVFVGVMFIALIPRLFAEQAVAGMMAESVPKLGRFNAGINLAYRGGGHILLLLMGWWTSFSGPFADDDVIDWQSLQNAGLATAMVTATLAVAITFIMREGEAIRGPGAQKKRRVAKTMQAAIEDSDLDFPEDASTMTRLLAAMRTRTAWVVLMLCFLMPLGDGFEGMFMFYMRDVLGFDAAQAIMWANVFIFATYLGLLGPWLSDHLGRAKVLRWSAQGSVVCYAGLGLLMLTGAPEMFLLILWMPTLMLTDWLMFTFITTWAEVSDPRLGPTHMALYQTTQAVAATFIWFGLGVFLIYVTGGAYWLIFLLACIGPLIGLSQFHKLRLGDEYGSDPIDVAQKVRNLQDKLAATPWGVEPVDGPSRRKLATATGIVGILLVAVLFGSSKFVLDWPEENQVESWSVLGYNNTSLNSEIVNTIGSSQSIILETQVPNTIGGILRASFTVDYIGTSSQDGEPEWKVSFIMPDRGNLSNGENTSTFEAEDWEGEMEIDFDASTPVLLNYSSEDALLGVMSIIEREMWWMHGRGGWTLRLDMTGHSSLLPVLEDGEFYLNLSITHMIQPPTNPNFEMVEFNTAMETTNHTYGTAVGVLLSFPILIATPFLVWVATRDPETLLV
jgi:hypothetical protein